MCSGRPDRVAPVVVFFFASIRVEAVAEEMEGIVGGGGAAAAGGEQAGSYGGGRERERAATS